MVQLEAGQAKRRSGVLPVRAAAVVKEEIRTYRIEEIYGNRGRDESVYYSSPWVFLMFWEVYRVPPPYHKWEDSYIK